MFTCTYGRKYLETCAWLWLWWTSPYMEEQESLSALTYLSYVNVEEKLSLDKRKHKRNLHSSKDQRSDSSQIDKALQSHPEIQNCCRKNTTQIQFSFIIKYILLVTPHQFCPMKGQTQAIQWWLPISQENLRQLILVCHPQKAVTTKVSVSQGLTSTAPHISHFISKDDCLVWCGNSDKNMFQQIYYEGNRKQPKWCKSAAICTSSWTK